MKRSKTGQSAVIIASPILYIVLGAGLLLRPGALIEYLCPALAVVMAVFGTIELYSYLTRPASENFQSNGFVFGLILLIAAETVFLQQEWIMAQVVLLLGFLVTLNGIRELQNWVDIVRLKVNNAWITAFVALLNLLLGAAVMTNIPLIANTRLTVAAVGLIFSGLADHITAIVAYAKGKCGINATGEETTVSCQKELENEAKFNGTPEVDLR